MTINIEQILLNTVCALCAALILGSVVTLLA